MGLMRFFCCLLPGRCDTEPAKPEKRTPATSVPTEVQPNTTGLLKVDSVARGALPGFPELGIQPKSIEEVLPTYIGR